MGKYASQRYIDKFSLWIKQNCVNILWFTHQQIQWASVWRIWFTLNFVALGLCCSWFNDMFLHTLFAMSLSLCLGIVCPSMCFRELCEVCSKEETKVVFRIFLPPFFIKFTWISFDTGRRNNLVLFSWLQVCDNANLIPCYTLILLPKYFGFISTSRHSVENPSMVDPQ